ncbi:hypothetical protein RSAG8_13117, partial [Rhizoctonia solani AG-8 WAC10335]
MLTYSPSPWPGERHSITSYPNPSSVPRINLTQNHHIKASRAAQGTKHLERFVIKIHLPNHLNSKPPGRLGITPISHILQRERPRRVHPQRIKHIRRRELQPVVGPVQICFL